MAIWMGYRNCLLPCCYFPLYFNFHFYLPMDSGGYGARLHIQMDTFSGTAALKWPTGCFEQVCRQNGFRIKGKVPLVFIRTFLLGSDRGTVLLYPSGTIIVIGAKSYELMIRIFHEGLIASLA